MSSDLRIICAGCGETIDIPSSQLGEALVCGDCGRPIDYNLYPPLAAALAERQENVRQEQRRAKAALDQQRKEAKEAKRREADEARRRREAEAQEARRAEQDRIREAERLRAEQAAAMAEAAANEPVLCPKCRSTQVAAGNRGFAVGKAVGWGLLLGPLGLLAGASGSSKLKVTCMKCGHSWLPGE